MCVPLFLLWNWICEYKLRLQQMLLPSTSLEKWFPPYDTLIGYNQN
jgi:hypothetical protein